MCLFSLSQAGRGPCPSGVNIRAACPPRGGLRQAGEPATRASGCRRRRDPAVTEHLVCARPFVTRHLNTSLQQIDLFGLLFTIFTYLVRELSPGNDTDPALCHKPMSLAERESLGKRNSRRQCLPLPPPMPRFPCTLRLEPNSLSCPLVAGVLAVYCLPGHRPVWDQQCDPARGVCLFVLRGRELDWLWYAGSWSGSHRLMRS